ncbi:MAG TPA: mandelate racemase/muconate lactonizing enzyme family protein [Bacillus sp. (in: firmicutes)]|nr:mandelate racemase/muconate lactonizing enzyme family protein [Bacillus sp. (in: firmicutes)]
MQIAKVEPIVIDMPLERKVQTSFGEMDRRTNVLVRIETDTREYGMGEIWNNFPSWGVFEKVTTLKYGIAPLLVGEDPRDIGKINQKLYSKLTVLCRQWGALGPMYHAISGVDIALWDLVGKHYGLPIHQLLGGKLSDEVEVYASGLGPVLLDELVTKHQEMGIRYYKLKVGKNSRVDLQNIKRLREMLNQNQHIMIDANQAWSRNEALENIRQYKDFQLMWVEEPIQCDDYEGLRLIREKTDMTVVAGENIYGREQVRKALEMGAIDLIQPDLSKNGGISECKVMVEMASSWDIPYAPHFLGGAICFTASLHFIASIPGGVILEMDANPNPFREKLFVEPFAVKNGKVKVPDGPGLGLEIDYDFLNFYKKDINNLQFI